MTLTLLGDVILGGYLTLIADRTGRRLVLIAGSGLMVVSGVVFAFVDNFWILLIAAVVAVISATGGDFGPFRAIEESVLSQLTTPDTRPDVLAWYVTFSTVGSALGSELSGRIVSTLRSKGWTLAEAYHSIFWLYVCMGLINAGLVSLLTKECEIGNAEQPYSQLPQQEVDLELEPAGGQEEPTKSDMTPPKQSWYKRFWSGFSGRLSQLSGSTLRIMVKLWFLLAVDSLADGMVPYSLTNYYVDEKFSPSKSLLGDINSVAYFLGAISTVFSGPLARKIGLVNSMVFTHLPSSAAVLLFPLAPNLVFTVILLFIRAGLNNMDQPPRSAFIAGVVRPDERTAAMGITAIIRSSAAMVGPTITGILAGSDNFYIAFIVAGSCRIMYDLGLYAMFINIKLYQHEGGAAVSEGLAASPRLSDEEMTELDDLDDKYGTEASASKAETPEGSSQSSEDRRLAPHLDPRVRRRSPSPLAKHSDPS